ncbi:S-layer homology domain-containing protein [Sporosarcina highlanderae]|uniref:S-layer homology domain-containing protein n=1 Tax=Sporosarcina highlanderae TaxID=3035916 RepID=A0ABT8JSC7_9BACL|nr:S-layer homology domain-containing protein [Sporosarcina highlanderae]MDN4608063.1 S-layer homology domain-containing protein [Sporosarcina highlanderae]
MKNRGLQKLTLVMTIMMLVLFTNHVAKANSPIVLPTGVQESGKIYPGSAETVYMVPVSEPGRLTIHVHSYINTTSITLKDWNGDTVYQEKAYDGKMTEASKWSKSVDLESGVYHLTIKDGSFISKETGTFLVSSEFSAANNKETEKNNAIELASELKLDANPLRGLISWNDTADFFKFELKSSGNLKLNFDSYLDEVNFTLLDGNGKKLFSEQVEGGKIGSPVKLTEMVNLEKGTYYIGIEQVRYSDSTGVYTLQALFGSVDNNEIEPNDSFGTAQSLLLNGQTIKGLISTNDHVDYFKFTTTKPSNVAVDLSVHFKSVNFELIDVNGNVIESSTVQGGVENNPKKMNKNVELASGTYFIKIEKDPDSKDVGSYVLKVQDATPTTVFLDVADRYKTAVNYLVANKITQGFSKTEFGVYAKIKRVDAAVMIVKALKLESTTGKDAGFQDVPARAANAVNVLVERGIMEGESKTKFGSDAELTRGEMALILSKAYKLDGTGTTIAFKDVSEKHSAAVRALVKYNITQGISDTQFGTSNSITRGDMAIFIHRVEQLK